MSVSNLIIHMMVFAVQTMKIDVIVKLSLKEKSLRKVLAELLHNLSITTHTWCVMTQVKTCHYYYYSAPSAHLPHSIFPSSVSVSSLSEKEIITGITDQLEWDVVTFKKAQTTLSLSLTRSLFVCVCIGLRFLCTRVCFRSIKLPRRHYFTDGTKVTSSIQHFVWAAVTDCDTTECCHLIHSHPYSRIYAPAMWMHRICESVQFFTVFVHVCWAVSLWICRTR